MADAHPVAEHKVELYIEGPAPSRPKAYRLSVATLARQWQREKPSRLDFIQCTLLFRIKLQTRVDLDNLTKPVLDGLMDGGLLPDDSQIYALLVFRCPVVNRADEGALIRLLWPLTPERLWCHPEAASMLDIPAHPEALIGHMVVSP